MPKRTLVRDSRARIFDAATVEFAERGFEAAGVDRIAAKARVNKAMIYYHFGSKLALYLEVTRDMLRAVAGHVHAIADGPATPEQKLDAWVATIVMFWTVTAFNVRHGFLPAPGWLKGFLGEFAWVLPVLHIGIIGMLILTRWWDFWTS